MCGKLGLLGEEVLRCAHRLEAAEAAVVTLQLPAEDTAMAAALLMADEEVAEETAMAAALLMADEEVAGEVEPEPGELVGSELSAFSFASKKHAIELEGLASCRRDCHSAAPPAYFSRCFNRDGEGMPAD